MARAIKVGDLKNQIGIPGPRTVLYCVCGAEFSANAGDYFMARPDTVMRCECGRNLRLGIPFSGYRTVKA